MAVKTEEKQAPSKGQSWKPVNDTTASLRRARVLRLRRAIWTTVVVGLALVLFSLLLAPFYFDRPYVFCLAVSDYEMLGAPAPSFAREDFRALGTLNGEKDSVLYNESADERGFRELPTGQTAAALANLKDQIQPALHGAGLFRNRDVLMVYLRAQGVSDSSRDADGNLVGEAYLLGSDFNPEFPNAGRVPLRRVLDQVKACSARVKIVFLDAGDITYDPRLGLIVNEFPRLLQREVAASADPSLWVLASHSSFERSHVIFPYRRSVFGYYIAAGLSGAADLDGDDNVTLRELAGYVVDRTSSWVGEYSGGADTQTPWLMRGTGPSRFIPSTTLVTVAPAEFKIPQIDKADLVPGAKPVGSGDTKGAETGATPAATGTPAEAKTASRDAQAPVPTSPDALDRDATAGARMALAWLTNGPVMWASYADASVAGIGPEPPRSRLVAQATAPAAPAAASAATGSAPAAANAPAAGAASEKAGGAASGSSGAASGGATRTRSIADVARAELDKAWKLHDALQTRGPNNRWAPADYAPHLWREFEETLVAYEQRLTGGASFSPARIAELLRTRILPLEAVVEGRPLKDDVNTSSIAYRLYQERPQFIPEVAEPRTLAASPLFAWPPGADAPKHFAELLDEWRGFEEAPRGDGFVAWAAREGTAHPTLAETQFLARFSENLQGLEWDQVKKVLRGLRMAEETAAAGEWIRPWIEPRLADADRLALAGKKELLEGLNRDLDRAARLLRDAEDRYVALNADVTLLARARALQADLIHRAPYYLHWRSFAGRSPQFGLAPAASDLDAMLTDLAALDEKLDSQDPGQIESLRPLVDRLEAVQGAIERSLQPGAVETLTTVETNQDQKPRIDPSRTHRVHVLLSTPLPTSDVRKRLLDFLATQVVEPGREARPAQNEPKTHEVTQADWLETSGRALREVKLLQLTAGPTTGEYFLMNDVQRSLKALQAAYGEWEKADPRSDRDAIIWTAYRRFGASIRAYYVALARDVRRVSRANVALTDPVKRPQQLAMLKKAARGLQLVAACDARSMEEVNPIEQLRQAEFRDFLVWHQSRFWKQTESGGVQTEVTFLSESARSYHDQAAAIPNQPAPPRLVERTVALEFTGPDSVVPLRFDAPASLQISVRPQIDLNAEAWVLLKYDPDLIQVKPPGELRVYHLHRLPADPDLLSEPVSFRVTPDVTQEIRLDVTAVSASENTTRLTVIVKTENVEAEFPVDLQPPYPQRYRLDVGAAGETLETGGGHLLMPYPNATTSFPMAIENLLAKDGKVRVALVALPLLNIGDARPLDWPLDDRGRSLDPDRPATLLAEIPSLVVPAGQSVPLVFPPPKAPIEQKPPPGAAPAGAAAGAEKPAEPPPPEISQGMAVVIEDLDLKRTVVHRLSLAAQKPSRYLKPTVRFNEALNRVEALIEAFDRDSLPPEGSVVTWEIGDQVPEGTSVLLEGKITAPDYRALLFAEVPPNPNRVMDVVLTVDGYPRAFIYHVRTAPSVAPATVDEDLTEIRIKSPKSGTLYKAPVATIPVQFEVDAPPDAFQDSSDVLEVGFDLDFDRTLNGERTWRFYSERMARIGLKGFLESGGLAISSKVGDFAFELETPRVQNVRSAIISRMLLSGEATYSNEVEIRLDSAGPKILPTGFINAVVGTESVALAMTAADELGDVQKVEVSVDPQKRGVFGATAPIAAELNQAGKWVASIPTKSYAVGTYQVLARGIDFAGNQGPVTTTMLEITPQPPPPVFTINGIVFFEKQPSEDVEVTLDVVAETKEEAEAKAQSTAEKEKAKETLKTTKRTRSDAQGRFRFDDVKPGSYVVNAHAVRKNKDRKAEGYRMTLTDQTKSAPFVRLTIANP